ncbi:MAG: hypothetical protein KGP37_07510, partial [Betaproteobacteria bacterium]|nr:hypothetical protein [Betaproteobacteria bacterium]
MPTVRSIGNPVPGAPADASGLGGVVPWMSEGQLSQPGQTGISSGEPHPFATELAAALAAKQEKGENQHAPAATKPAQISGQNLPKQVGTQRDALAKFAEKESNAASSGQNSSAAETPLASAGSEGLNPPGSESSESSSVQSADPALGTKETVEAGRLAQAALVRDAATEAAAAKADAASDVAAIEAAKVAANAVASAAAIDAASAAAQEAANKATNATATTQGISVSVSNTALADNNPIASQGAISDTGPSSGLRYEHMNAAGMPATGAATGSLQSDGTITSSTNGGVSNVIGAVGQSTTQSSPSNVALNGGTNAAANTLADAALATLVENLATQNHGQTQAQTQGQSTSHGAVTGLASGGTSQAPVQALAGQAQGSNGSSVTVGASSGDVISLGSKTAAGLVAQVTNTIVAPVQNETATAASAVKEAVARIAAQLESDAAADATSDTVAAALSDTAAEVKDALLKSGVNRLNSQDTAALKNQAVQNSIPLTEAEQALLKQQANAALVNQSAENVLLDSRSQSQVQTQITGQALSQSQGQTQSQRSVSSQDLLSQSQEQNPAAVVVKAATQVAENTSKAASNTAGSAALTGAASLPISGNAVPADQGAQQVLASQAAANQSLMKGQTAESLIALQESNAVSAVDGSGAEEPSALALKQPSNLATKSRAGAQGDQLLAQPVAQNNSSSTSTDSAQKSLTPSSAEPGSPSLTEKASGMSMAGQLQPSLATRANSPAGPEALKTAAVTLDPIKDDGVHQAALSKSQIIAQESLVANGNSQSQSPSQSHGHTQGQTPITQSVKAEPGKLMESAVSEVEVALTSSSAATLSQSVLKPSSSAQAMNTGVSAAQTAGQGLLGSQDLQVRSTPSVSTQETTPVTSAQQTPGAGPLSATTTRSPTADMASAAGLVGQSSDVSQTSTVATPIGVPSMRTPASDSAASPVTTVATSAAAKDKNAAALAAERAITVGTETAAVAQTVTTVNGSKQESTDSKSAANTARLGVSESFDSGIKNAADLASGGEGFDGSNSGDPSEQTPADSVRLNANAKPGAEFGSVIRSASESASTPAEIARQAAQKVDAASSAGLSNTEVLARAENRLEAARASFGSGLLNVEVLRLTRQGGGRAVLEVTPPNEGPIRLDLKLDGAGRATLLVDGLSEAMKTRLEGSSHLLRQDMSQMGLALNLEMRERQESNAFANAMAFGQGQGGESDSASRRGLTQGKSSSIRGGGDAVTSS